MCSREWQIEGRATVEVALLFPTIFFLILWLCYFMLFMLDMSIAKSEAIRIADEAAAVGERDGQLETGRFKLSSGSSLLAFITSYRNKGQAESKAKTRLKKRMKERLVMTSPRKVDVGIGKKVRAQAGVRFSLPHPGLRISGGAGFTFLARAVSPADDWEDQMRKALAGRKKKKDAGE